MKPEAVSLEGAIKAPYLPVREIHAKRGTLARRSPVAAKRCRCCGETKDAAEFARNARLRDGLHSWCRVCMAAAMKRWRGRNRDKVEAYNRSRRVRPDFVYTHRVAEAESSSRS
jgi:hypothetical protein